MIQEFTSSAILLIPIRRVQKDVMMSSYPKAGPNMVIENVRVFKDLPALKRWLPAFAVIRKRSYKCIHMRSAVTQLCVTRNAAHGGFVQGSKMSQKMEDHKSCRATQLC